MVGEHESRFKALSWESGELVGDSGNCSFCSGWDLGGP